MTNKCYADVAYFLGALKWMVRHPFFQQGAEEAEKQLSYGRYFLTADRYLQAMALQLASPNVAADEIGYIAARYHQRTTGC